MLRIPAYVPLLGIGGSRAYGLDHPGSDTDWRGVFIEDSNRFLGVRTPRESFNLDEQDVVIYELRKFAWLCLQGNPNTLEILNLPTYVLEDTPISSLILRLRTLILHRKTLTPYVGFANSQIQRAKRLQDDLPKKEKALRHLFRLIHQAYGILHDGQVRVRLDPEERELIIAQSQQSIPDAVSEAEWHLQELKRLAAEDRPWLPAKPRTEEVDDLVMRIRSFAQDKAFRYREGSGRLMELPVGDV